MGFHCSGFGWEGWMPWGGAWGSMGMVGLILNLMVFVGMLALLGLGIAWLVRQLSRRAVASQAAVDPLEIARRRLASGEITIVEFEEIRDRLHS